MENSTIQQEIAQLEQQIKQRKSQLEQSGTVHDSISEKELLHQTVGEQIQQHMPSYVPTPAPVAPSKSTASSDDTPSYLLPELHQQVQDLVNLAFSSSISDAIKAAEKANNPALVDAFHDVLVDELYEQLKERQKIPSVE